MRRKGVSKVVKPELLACRDDKIEARADRFAAELVRLLELEA
jgi:hypothetical protein